MTAAITTLDPTLRAIAGRALAARASTGPLGALGADVDRLLARLEAAEAAVVAAEDFYDLTLPLVDRFGRVTVAEADERLLGALRRWREIAGGGE